jgi:hypothetical protein
MVSLGSESISNILSVLKNLVLTTIHAIIIQLCVSIFKFYLFMFTFLHVLHLMV